MRTLFKKSIITLIVFALLCLPTLQFSSAQDSKTRAPQKSFGPGIAQTQQALIQINKEIEENVGEASRLFSRLLIDSGEALGNPSDFSNAIKLVKQAYSGYLLGKANSEQNIAEAISEAANIIANIWGEVDPKVKIGKLGVEEIFIVLEASAILARQAKLIDVRRDLEIQLFRLRGKDPENQAKWEEILRNLHNNVEKEHAAFRYSGISRQQIVLQAVKNAKEISPQASTQVASGIVIVDPQEGISAIEKIPGINPDFIEALRREREFLLQGRVYEAMMANKYSDGGYITAFGTSRGINNLPLSDYQRRAIQNEIDTHVYGHGAEEPLSDHQRRAIQNEIDTHVYGHGAEESESGVVGNTQQAIDECQRCMDVFSECSNAANKAALSKGINGIDALIRCKQQYEECMRRHQCN